MHETRTASTATLALMIALALLLTACAPGINEQMGTANAAGLVAGFWRGLWQGIIAPVTFVVSLFSSSVRMYEVHNNGGWYDFGYLLGVTCTFGGGSSARRVRR